MGRFIDWALQKLAEVMTFAFFLAIVVGVVAVIVLSILADLGFRWGPWS